MLNNFLIAQARPTLMAQGMTYDEVMNWWEKWSYEHVFDDNVGLNDVLKAAWDDHMNNQSDNGFDMGSMALIGRGIESTGEQLSSFNRAGVGMLHF